MYSGTHGGTREKRHQPSRVTPVSLPYPITRGSSPCLVAPGASLLAVRPDLHQLEEAELNAKVALELVPLGIAQPHVSARLAPVHGGHLPVIARGHVRADLIDTQLLLAANALHAHHGAQARLVIECRQQMAGFGLHRLAHGALEKRLVVHAAIEKVLDPLFDLGFAHRLHDAPHALDTLPAQARSSAHRPSSGWTSMVAHTARSSRIMAVRSLVRASSASRRLSWPCGLQRWAMAATPPASTTLSISVHSSRTAFSQVSSGVASSVGAGGRS